MIESVWCKTCIEFTLVDKDLLTCGWCGNNVHKLGKPLSDNSRPKSNPKDLHRAAQRRWYAKSMSSRDMAKMVRPPIPQLPFPSLQPFAVLEILSWEV